MYLIDGEYVENTNIKVFSQLFLGFRKQNDDEPPLGFATPLENNSAGRKRQETVKHWAKLYSSRQVRTPNGEWVTIKSEPEFRTVDNVPREGFIITDDVRRIYYGGGNVVWRVFDPYGYELEIQSQNLFALIKTIGIDKGGLIPGKCIWGRGGGDNVLLHESSKEYQTAIKAAESLKLAPAVKKSQRMVGSAYTLQSGKTGVFLGPVWVVSIRNTPEIGIPTNGFYTHVHERYPVVEQYDAVFIDGQTTLYKKAPLVNLVGEAQAVEGFPNPSFAGSNNDTIVSVTRDKPDQISWETAPYTLNDFKAAFPERHPRQLEPSLYQYFYGQREMHALEYQGKIAHHLCYLPHIYGTPVKQSALLGQLVIDGDRLQVVSYYPWSRQPNNDTIQLKTTEVLRLPDELGMYGNHSAEQSQALGKWLNDQLKEGHGLKVYLKVTFNK